MVAGANHTIFESMVGGKGFTAILVSWIGGFSVPLMALYSFLITFVSVGSDNAASWIGYSSNISKISVALFFILMVASTFFINFKVHIRLPKLKKGGEENVPQVVEAQGKEEQK